MNHDGPVIYTLDTHPDNYLDTREGRALPVDHCIKGTEGWEVFGETKKALIKTGAKGLEKRSFGLAPQELAVLKDELFQKDCFKEIELVGLVTNICIISNAVIFQAAYPEAQIVVDGALCASFDRELHEKTLDVLTGLQVRVLNRTTVLQ
jgi:nicotinamidase-related amidase